MHNFSRLVKISTFRDLLAEKITKNRTNNEILRGKTNTAVIFSQKKEHSRRGIGKIILSHLRNRHVEHLYGKTLIAKHDGTSLVLK